MAGTTKRYRAFISYSQRDKLYAARLHSALEAYRLPAGIDAPVDQKTRKLGRFFRDDEEMGAATDLGLALEGAIADSESLIVICSPHAAQSKWVNEEVLHFKRTDRADNIFAVIVAGNPNASASDDESQHPKECFPPALRFAVDGDGRLTDRLAEPLGIDFRKEEFQRLRARLAAGLLAIPFDALWQRESRRIALRRLSSFYLYAASGIAAVLLLIPFAAGWIEAAHRNQSPASALLPAGTPYEALLVDWDGLSTMEGLGIIVLAALTLFALIRRLRLAGVAMRSIGLIFAMVWSAALLSAPLSVAQTPSAPGASSERLADLVARGERLATHCRSCHSMERGGVNRQGPNLWGVVGRRVATGEEFEYSRGLRIFSGVWTEERLAAYLQSPRDVVPATSMDYRGLRGDDNVRAMMAFLQTLSDEPRGRTSEIEEAAIPSDEAEPNPAHDLVSATSTQSAGGRDRLRRGFAVYHQICSVCHSTIGLRFSRLGEPGGPAFSEEEIASLASSYVIQADDEMSDDRGRRPGRTSDAIPAPYANDVQARAANGGRLPPDLSRYLLYARQAEPPELIAGIDAIQRRITGQRDALRHSVRDYLEGPYEAPASTQFGSDEYNHAYHTTILPPGILYWQDGGSLSTMQMVEETVLFLEWAAEPDWRGRRLQAIRAILYWACALFALVTIAAAPIIIRRTRISRDR